MATAKGTFEMQTTPQQAADKKEHEIAVMILRKQFNGDLEATGEGMLLSALSGTDGSAGYVAMERVSGKMDGMRGTFLLQHNGIMNRGTPYVTAVVVPDSGTDELLGLEGRMKINIVEGRHSYSFEYSLRFHAA